jgi:FkbM family methyltransferase
MFSQLRTKAGELADSWETSEIQSFPRVTNLAARSLRGLQRLALVAAGRDLWQTRQLRTETLTLGGRKASWTLCPSPLLPTSTVYSLGVGDDISFDLELIQRFGVTVHAFDPTPRTMAWIKTQTLPAGFVFHPLAVGASDGTCPFLPPCDPRHISHSVIPRATPWPAIQVPVHRLTTILRVLGHESIDLLKMDIEGAEYDVIRDLLQAEIHVGQLLVEFHHRWREVGTQPTRRAIRELNAAGYRIFHVSPREEYSFLNTRSR